METLTIVGEYYESIQIVSYYLSFEEERMRLNRAEQERIAYEKMIAEVSSMGLEIEDVQWFLNECMQVMGNTLDVGGIFLW